jgi:hypothetical protein
MQLHVDLRFNCVGCGGIVDVEMDYNPTMDCMPPMATNHVKVPVCEQCVQIRLLRVAQKIGGKE